MADSQGVHGIGRTVERIESQLDGEGTEGKEESEREDVTGQNIMIKSQRQVLWD